MIFRQKILTSDNIVINRLFPERYFSRLYMSRKYMSVLTGSKYIAIKNVLLQINECPRLRKINVPKMTDLLRYLPMLDIFDCEKFRFNNFIFKYK